MKRFFLLSLVALLPLLAGAYDAQIDGIYYNFSGAEATVTYLYKFSNSNSAAYSGAVTIPRTVTHEGNTYVVTSIGEFAFYRCNSLTKVTIPNSVNSIGNYAFCYCTGMSAFNIPSYVTSIGHHAFADTPWYDGQSDGLVYAGKVAYQYKGGMASGTEIAIKEGTIGIASQAFYECTNMTKVTIPNGVSAIGEEAFYGCLSLTDVFSYISFPCLASNDMFADISSKATLHIPQNTTAEYRSAGWTSYFRNVVEMEQGISDVFTAQTKEGVMMAFRILDKDKKTCQVGSGDDAAVSISTTGQITIPSEVYGYKVTAIGEEAFFNRSNLTGVVIPDGVERIGILAFHRCAGIGTLDIPGSVTYISNDAFSECSMQVNIPYEVIVALTYNRPSESNVTIMITPPSQSTVNLMERIYIPSSANAIYERAFSGCKAVKVIEVQSSSTTFDSPDGCNAVIRKKDGALLFGCQNTVIPETVKAIGPYAFEGHSNLKTIRIPIGVTSIGSGAFSGCTALTSITSAIKVPFSINDNTFSAYTYENATLTVPAGAKDLYQAQTGWKKFANIVEAEWMDGDDFVVKTKEGVSVSFRVTSVQNKTCEVMAPAIAKSTTGAVTIPETPKGFSVKTIVSAAFSGCTGITSVVIPNSVTSIGQDAFSGCTGLTSATIPKGVTSIGRNAYENCRSLAYLTVASGNTVYDSRGNCNAIIEKQTSKLIRGCKTTSIPSDVKSIAERAFSGCTGLTSVNINGNMTSIGAEAFTGCTGLLSVTSELKAPFAINDNTFSSNTYENATLVVPPDMREVYEAKDGWKKFANILEKERVDGEIYTATTTEGVEMTFKVVSAKNKTCQVEGSSTTPAIAKGTKGAVTIPEIAKGFSVKTISAYAFSGCTGMTSVSIPASVTTIGDHAFANCTGLTTYKVDEGNVIFNSRGGCNAIVRSATDALIAGCKNSVITESMKAIGQYAFEGQTGLKSLTIPKGITSIGNGAFMGCSALVSITSNIIEPFAINDNTFSDYTYANATLTVPIETEDYYMTQTGWKKFANIVEEYVELLDGDTFTAKSVERVKIRFRVTSAQNKTCQIIAPAIEKTVTGSLTIPEIARGFTVTTMAASAFSGCTGLTSVVIPKSVTNIAANAFTGCSGITSVTIPNSVTSIGLEAFSDCISLASITIPSSVTSIGRRVFTACRSLTSMSVASGNSVYDSRNNCNAIIKSSDNSLLFGCQKTVIPETVKAIASYAFEGHAYLKTIGFSKTLTSIGEAAFSGCTALMDIYSDLKAPFSINDNTFSDYTYANATLTVPAAKTEVYQATLGWMNFKKFAEKEHEDGDIFTFNTEEGVSMTFKVLSSNNKTCQVEGSSSSPAIDKGTTGSVTIPASPKGYSVINITPYAFSGCSALTKVTIPNSVTNIGERAFSGCTLMMSLTIPSNVTKMGNDAFDACRSLTSISVANGNTVYDSRNNCNAIIEKQTNTLIRGCKNTSIPNSVRSISEKAFSGCSSMTSIYIPESLTSIGNAAFTGCTSLKTVISDLTAPFAINDNTFSSNTYENATLVVPPDTKEIYQAKAGWKNFIDIEEKDRQDGDIFTAETEEGVLMTFKVISVQNRTCQVEGTSNSTAIDKATSGSVTIPEIAKGYYITSISSFAFYYCTGMTSVTIPSRVKSIGSYAFSGCKGLTSIIIPSSVTSIGDGALEACSYLTAINVNYENTVYNSRNNSNAIIRTADNTLLFGCQKTVIPATVKAIAAYAFKGQSNLKTINIPNSVTSIGIEAFSGCSSLMTITSAIKAPFTINENTFSDNTYQNGTLNIPAFTKELYQAKAGWANFRDMVEEELKDGEEFIAETKEGVKMSFKVINAQDKTCQVISPAVNKSTTGSITIPENVGAYSIKSIANSAFSGCTGLTSVSIPYSITSIGEEAFSGCTGLTSLYIPSSVTSIGRNAFDACRSLASISVASGNTVYDSRNNCNAIIEKRTNTLIRGCKNTSISNSVTSIGQRAFSGCTTLTSINFHEYLTSIGEEAFTGCTGLMTISSEIKEPFSISNNTFSDYTYQNASVIVPTGTKELYLATAGWKNFSNLEGKEMKDGEVFKAKTVEGIEMTFRVISAQNKTCQVEGTSSSPSINRDTSGSLTIPEIVKGYTVKSITSYAFYYCSGITSVTIPNTVISIGEYAFCYCNGLTSVTIPDSVTSIGGGAFFGCNGLTSVIIGSGVTNISYQAFSDCGNLTSIKVEEGNTTYDSRNNCNAIIETAKNTLIVGCKNTVIPYSVTKIGNYAFDGCSGLTSIIITEGVTNIESYAFRSCTNLAEVSLPSSITNISSNAFRECTKLTDFYCYAESVPKTNSSAFDESPIAFATLYVPEEALESYRGTAPWSGFGTIVPLEGKTCATPTISYINGELIFDCATKDVKFIYKINDDDIKNGISNKVKLTVTYHISVYAIKDGYNNSDVATATLCWIDQIPATEGIFDEDAVMEVKAVPVLIQSKSGTITVQGVAEGTEISVYSVDGMRQGTAIALKGGATINTSLQSGAIAIVKIGEESSVKVVVK